MATKTITLELDAYEKLKTAKQSPKESFSSVVRRAVFEKKSFTAQDLLEFMEQRAVEGSLLSEKILDKLEEAQKQPHRSSFRWKES